MAQREPLNFEQPNNELSQIAEMERRKLLPKNDFVKDSNEYSSVNPASNIWKCASGVLAC